MWLIRLLDMPLLKGLRDAVATIRAASFVTTGIAALSLVVYLAWRRQELRLNHMAIIAGTLLTLGTFAWAVHHRARLLPTNAYEILSLESTLFIERVNSHHRYTMTKDCRIVSRRNDLRLVDQRWYWTGKGSRPYELCSLANGHVIFDGKRPEQDNWTHRWVYLGGRLSRGEATRVGTVLTVEDDVEPMRPFFTDGGKGYRTHSLKLTLRFPLGTEPSRVEGRIWTRNLDDLSVRGELAVIRIVDSTNSFSEYVATIEHPLRNRRYGLQWEW
jgi:hypothetical protein